MESVKTIQARIEALKNLQKTSGVSETKASKFECDLCRDVGWTVGEGNVAVKCKCFEKKLYEQLLKNSGLGEALKGYTFESYSIENAKCKIAKKEALGYVEEFESIRNTRHNSIAYLGQSGSGKTHITTAILNALMAKGVGVRYMPYVDDITKLKQLKTDGEEYQREINRYKTAPVLMIDDLFKRSTGRTYNIDADVRIMYEILNHRVLANMPVIYSSELSPPELLNIDVALGGRIIEACEGRIVSMAGADNYRLKNKISSRTAIQATEYM